MTLIISSGRNASDLSALPRDQAAQVASQSPASTQANIYGALNQLETALLERFQGENNQVASIPGLMLLGVFALGLLLPIVVRPGSESVPDGCLNSASPVCRRLKKLRHDYD
jgi:hypothetical protein